MTEEKLNILEEAVLDAVLMGQTDDRVLGEIIEIITISKTENLPIYSNILDEPKLFRLTKRWVEKAIKAAADIEKAKAAAIAGNG